MSEERVSRKALGFPLEVGEAQEEKSTILDWDWRGPTQGWEIQLPLASSRALPFFWPPVKPAARISPPGGSPRSGFCGHFTRPVIL